jgi:hypothetical protein
MLAESSLPVSSSQPKIISAQMIADLSGAAYVGPQPMDAGVFHYFREPVTGSTVGVWDRDLSFDFLELRLQAARIRFGVA